MKRALALLLVLVGCESKGALDIVVPHLDGVTDVRLYIGVGAAMELPIAPEGFTKPLSPTKTWTRDKFADQDVRIVQGDDDVVFQLMKSDAGDDTLKVAIVVGFDVDGTALAAAKLDDIKIPGDSVARRIVPLTLLSAQTALVTTWPHDNADGTNRCVAYTDRVAQPLTSLVVDGDDPDCDGVAPPLECSKDNYVYKAKRAATLTEVMCVKSQTVYLDLGSGSGSNLPGCVLGGPNCTDGEAPDPANTCAVTSYCTPGSVCNKCAGRFACAADVLTLGYGNLPAYIDCTVNRDAVGQLCAQPLTVQLDSLLRFNGTKCTGPIVISHGAGWGPTATFTAPNVAGSAALSVSGLDANCNFTVQVTATLAQNATSPGVAGIVAGMLDNGRGFAIPLVVTGETSAPCEAGITCHMSASSNIYVDLMKECLYSPVLGP